MEPPQRFYRDLDKRAIKFGVSRPDLLRVVAGPSSCSSSSQPKRSLVIIDAKSSAKTKFSQQVQVRIQLGVTRRLALASTPHSFTKPLLQVAFYALLLRSLIDEEQIDDLEIGPEGGTPPGTLRNAVRPNHPPS